MSVTNLRFEVVLASTTCPDCGVEYAMPEHMLSQRRANGGSVYCPSGHVGSWKESEADRLRKQLAEKERLLLEKEASLKHQRARAEKAEDRETKAKRKLERVKNGVCPCCKRTVSQLARHMKTKHPEFKP